MKDRGYVQVVLRGKRTEKYYLGRNMIGGSVSIVAEFTNPTDLANTIAALNSSIGMRILAEGAQG